MGFRFRKSIKIAPGLKLNIGKKSMGVSVGNKFGGVSYNTKTGAHARASAPGTGISYTEKIGDAPKAQKSHDNPIIGGATSGSAGMPPKGGRNYQMWFKIIRWAFVVMFSAATVGMFPSFASIVFLLAAFLAAPIDSFDAFVRDKLHIGNKIKIAIIVALFVLGGVTMPKTEKSEAPAANNSISEATDKTDTTTTTQPETKPTVENKEPTDAGSADAGKADANTATGAESQAPASTSGNTSSSSSTTTTSPTTETPQQTEQTPAAADPTPEPEPTPEPAVTIPYESNYNGHVYASPSGERYHYDPDCAGKNGKEITWDTVNARHLTPCQKCVEK